MLRNIKHFVRMTFITGLLAITVLQMPGGFQVAPLLKFSSTS